MENIIKEIENYCKKNYIDHRFVGGVSFGGLLKKETTWKIDIKNRIVQLKNNNSIQKFRDDGTIRDIDLIIFCSNYEKIEQLRKYVNNLKRRASKFPSVSIESAIYNNEKLKKNVIPQFVTALEIDKENNLYFSFDNVKQHISWNTFEAWTVILENGTLYSVRNPVADYFAYYLRLPSGIKPKDKKKIIFLNLLANDAIQEGKKYHIDYLSRDYFGNWKTYIKKLENTQEFSILFKKKLLFLYWETIGTSLAHEHGFFGKLFAPFANQFTGSRQ